MRNRKRVFVFLLLLVSGLILSVKPLLEGMGGFLIKETVPLQKGDAAVVLFTGADYTARLIEAAEIYNKGLAGKVVIDGDRKSGILKELEEKGYREACHWSVNQVGVLNFFGVPGKDIIIIDAPDAYDTVTEAVIVGRYLKKFGMTELIITTSKFHTRRAGYIWQSLYRKGFDIQVAAAGKDPFDMKGWWRDRRQIRQLLAEYGAWFYYLVKHPRWHGVK